MTGLLAGAVQVGVTHAVTALFPLVWPEWETPARALYAWSSGHAPLFLGSTLVLAVTAEEALWRGVVARFLIERWGEPPESWPRQRYTRSPTWQRSIGCS